jgi:hypothetical protein
MPTAGLEQPDAEDLQPTDIDPAGELEACNHLLDDHRALMRSYEDDGYLLLRGVLDLDSIERARDEMLAVAANHGLVESGDKEGRWTGKTVSVMEESPEFAGISRRLVEHPRNNKLLQKVLGEPACAVPIVQYRIYPPNGPATMVHQDGFYSPGIRDYKPIWITLTPCQRELGGLMLAVRQNKRGYLHNVAKPAPYKIPKGVIPEQSWSTTDYYPGDVLIVHPFTPHATRPNRSDRLRVTFDTRVQSARNPSAVAATIAAVTDDSITVNSDLFGQRTYRVTPDTFMRIQNTGAREPFETLIEIAKPGMRIVVVSEGDRAVMLRRAAEG